VKRLGCRRGRGSTGLKSGAWPGPRSCGLCGEEVRGRAPVEQGAGEEDGEVGGVDSPPVRSEAGRCADASIQINCAAERDEWHGRRARIGTKRLPGRRTSRRAIEVASAGMTDGSDGPLSARGDNVFLAGPGL
jgi:hypothetical protein